MLGHRVRRFRLENVLSKATSRSVRIQSPAFQALNAVNISSNFLQSNAYSTSCIVASSVAKPYNESPYIDFTAICSDEITPSPDGSELLKFHTQNFYDATKHNVYEVRTGSYVDVKEDDIAKYFQEGLAGAANDEFEFTSNKRWMIRDSTKVLFRVIEETEKRLKYDASAFLEKNNKKSISTIDSSAHVGLHSKIQIPRFQGKAEWPESQMKVSYYGRDLVPTNFDASAEVEGFIKTKGPGSMLETTIDNLKNAAKEANQEIPDRVILSGGRGHGKSMVLNQAVLYARQRGWLTVFVPNGWEQVQHGPYIQPMTVPGPEKKVVYDNPYMDKVFLRGLWKAHKEQLKDLPISSKDVLSKYEAKLQSLRRAMQLALQLPGRDKLSFIELRSIIIEDDEDRLEEYDTLDADCLNQYNFMTNKLETLDDLLKLGVAFDFFSGLVVRDLIMELRQQTHVPVLFAVDEYNTWFMPSAFGYEGKGSLLGKELNLPDALLFLDTKKKKGAATNWTLNHGLCLAATSFTHAEATKRPDLVRFDTELKDSLPLRIKVNAYTQEEYLSAVSYYFQKGTSPVAPVASWEDFFLFRMVTMSNPRLVRYENMKFFFPRNVTGLEQELEMAALLGVSDPTKTNRAEDFDPTLGFNEDAEEEEKAAEGEEEVIEGIVEKESFLGAIERKDEDDYYPDLEDDDDDDYEPRRTSK